MASEELVSAEILSQHYEFRDAIFNKNDGILLELSTQFHGILTVYAKNEKGLLAWPFTQWVSPQSVIDGVLVAEL